MVLVRNLLVACALLLMAGCVKQQPVQRLSSPQAIAVAVVHDRGSGLGEVPAAMNAEVKGALDARNLVMEAIPPQQYRSAFAQQQASRARMKSLQGMAAQAPLYLLVETRAEFYAQLNGRFRWSVYAKISLAQGDGEPTVSSFDLPVLLNFDHQREEEALAAAAAPIARKLGQELDDFLAGLNLKTVASTGPTPAPVASPELESVYFVMVDRFANGDSSNDEEIDLADPQAFHGGDLKGLIGKLDHIAQMGFRTVWLSPIFSMRTEKIGEHGAFHGYWTEDLREVEKRFGSREDLLKLKEELAARDMHLVMDMVLNHVGYDTKFVSEKPSWFHGKGDIKDWNDPVQLTTYDVHGLPDLAQEKPEVYEFLLSASAQWVENLSPVGFRLDAVKHVGSEFWEKYTRDIQKHSDAPLAMIGELYNGNPSVIARGFREDGFTHLFDFPLYFALDEVFCKGEHAGRLASTLSLDRLYPDPSRLITFADNHDLPRVWSACGEDRGRTEALLTFLLSARGIPSINYGTEVPLAGKGDPENRKDMNFETPAPLASVIQKLLAMRQEHTVFRKGHDLPLTVDKEHYAYVRVGEEESALVALNLGKSSWSFADDSLEGAVDALTGETLTGTVLAVPPTSTRVLLLSAASAAPHRQRVQSSLKAPQMQSVVVLAQAAGPELRLVGGGPELGDWEPSKAPKGVRESDGRFRFELELPQGSTGAFKLVEVSESGSKWEERGNRFVTASATDTSPLEITYGKTEETR